MTPRERQLLKQLAEAYAFISDIRETGIRTSNRTLVARTEGIENKIDELQKEYPRVFNRYYTGAIRRARDHVLSELKRPAPEPQRRGGVDRSMGTGYGKGKEKPRREEKTDTEPRQSEKRQSKPVRRPTPRKKPKAPVDRRRKKPE